MYGGRHRRRAWFCSLVDYEAEAGGLVLVEQLRLPASGSPQARDTPRARDDRAARALASVRVALNGTASGVRTLVQATHQPNWCLTPIVSDTFWGHRSLRMH